MSTFFLVLPKKTGITLLGDSSRFVKDMTGTFLQKKFQKKSENFLSQNFFSGSKIFFQKKC